MPQFVGLENYVNLLTFRLDTVDCKKSVTDGPCDTRANGSIRWESINRELLREGYRTIFNLRLGDQSLAIIGLFMALVVNSKFRGRGAMRAVMLAPWS